MSTNDGQVTSSNDRGNGPNSGSTSARLGYNCRQTLFKHVWLDTIDERRRGIITTSQATIRLVKLLPDPTSIHALDRYTEKLDEIDRLHADAHRRGRTHLTFESDPIPGKSGNATHKRSDAREPGKIDNEANEPSINKNIDEEQLTRDLNPRKRGPDESLYAFNHPTNIRPPIDPKLELMLNLKQLCHQSQSLQTCRTWIPKMPTHS